MLKSVLILLQPGKAARLNIVNAQRVPVPVEWDIKADISQGAPPLLPGIPVKPFKKETLPKPIIDPADVQHSAAIRRTAWARCQKEAGQKPVDVEVLEAIYRHASCRLCVLEGASVPPTRMEIKISASLLIVVVN